MPTRVSPNIDGARGCPEDCFYLGAGHFLLQKMPFGLKNAGATYQRLVDRPFQKQIGRNMEVYVDDMVVKSRTFEAFLDDLREVFNILRQINMKLNPAKCTFGVGEGKFLGYMISEQDIKANPKKVQAILDMASPSTVKELQSLNGKLAALNRFLSKSAERALPFFKTLKEGILEGGKIAWTEAAEQAFVSLKHYLQQLPALTTPSPGEMLYLYIATTAEALSAVLLREEAGVQRPIYYVNKLLKGPETRYPVVEKLVLALVHASRRLKHYFQAHPVTVLTNQPLKQILHRPEASGRLVKWAVELGEHDITFAPRTAVKGQVLADFLVEMPSTPVPEIPSSKSTQPTKRCKIEGTPSWTLFVDGASGMEGAGAGLLLIDPDGLELAYALRFDFPASNNEAEYEALIAGLHLALKVGAKAIQVYGDSQLMVRQVQGSYDAKDACMKKYRDKVRILIPLFDTFQIDRIPRSQNKRADALSKLASSANSHLTKEVLVEVLPRPSIAERPVLTVTDTEDTWMTPIFKYLTNGELPQQASAARSIRMKAAQYTLRDGTLYKKGYLQPWLRCVGPTQAQYVLQESRLLRKPQRSPVYYPKGNPAWVLLAYHVSRCRSFGSKMPGLSIARSHTSCAPNRPHQHAESMAFFPVGN